MAEKYSTGWGDIRAYMDWSMVVVTLVLLCCGIAAIYSASSSFANGAAVSSFVLRQMAWGTMGAVLYILVLKADYRNVMRFAWPLFAAIIAIFILLLVAGHTAKGSQRWFNLGFFRFQPSELGKVIFALTLAKLCSALPPHNIKGIGAALLAAASVISLIMLQPDLGSALVYAAMLAAVFVAAGTPAKILAAMAAAGAAMLPLGWLILKPYQRMRLLVFLDPMIDPQGAGYNVIQSRIAVGSGGLFGKGFMRGTQGKLHFLPEPHTDFIFSVFSEEFGFIGATIVILLFAVLLWRILSVSLYTRDLRAKLMCVAIAAWLWFQIMESVAMSMGLAPVTGLPLPLFSYGGSSLLVIAIGLGLVQSVNIVARKERF
ncbi:MAG: rod shape-determining protein RodA [Synergistaceae bacterium]|nr:rod shape-determining protein RodA [Synergistaceae bacterium]